MCGIRKRLATWPKTWLNHRNMVWKSRWPISNAQRFFSCSNAWQSWSGHDVGFAPQRMPLRRLMTSSIFWPFTNRLMPCRLPLHPPTKNTCCMTSLSSTVTSITLEHVPSVWYCMCFIIQKFVLPAKVRHLICNFPFCMCFSSFPTAFFLAAEICLLLSTLHTFVNKTKKYELWTMNFELKVVPLHPWN